MDGVVLLSGGIDSAVTAWFAKKECDKLYAITFRYGQAHKREVDCALKLGEQLGVKGHLEFCIPLQLVSSSSLFNPDEVPTKERSQAMAQTFGKAYGPSNEGKEKTGIPSTWVPQRNSIFLAIAFGWAEALGCEKVYIGANCIDYSSYPDCRPEFRDAIEEALNLGSKDFVEEGKKIRLVTPLMFLKKSEIIKFGIKLGVPLENTWSCYKGGEKACGLCSSCQIRLEAFKKAGVEDPIKYKE